MARVISKLRRSFVLFMLLVMLMTGFGGTGTNVSAASGTTELPDSMIRTDLTDMKDETSSISYAEYLKVYTGVTDAKDNVVLYPFADDGVSGVDVEKTDATYKVLDSFGINDEVRNNALVIGDDGRVTLKFSVPETGLYSIEVEYYTGSVYIYTCPCADGKKACDECGEDCSKCETVVYTDEPANEDKYCSTCGVQMTEAKSKNSAIERKIFIDGSVPFKEARSVEFQRTWIDGYRDLDGNVVYSNTEEYYTSVYYKTDESTGKKRYFLKDSNGNEKKPEKHLYAEWCTTAVYDSTGYASEPLKFYLEKGEHTIAFDAIREPAVFSSIVLRSFDVPISYDQYIKEHDAAGATDVPSGTYVTVQGEDSYKTSSNTIYQTGDRASSLTVPQDVSETRLNEIGGDKWQYVGQTIEWVIDVPVSGYYKIVPRSIQDFYSGVYVSRKLYIDGELPFAEAAKLRFNYTDSWQTKALTDGDTEFKFYLEEGLHFIKMEVVLGEMATILSSVETSLNNINSYYRKILMITGPDADEYRDYGFERMLPDVVRGLRAEAANLTNISSQLEEIIGYKGDHSVTLDKVAYTVSQMGNNPSKIASLMDDLKTQSGSLGTWLTQTQNQPLNIDYIKVMCPTDKNPKAEAGFLRELWQEILKFIMSFFTDYTSISSTSKDNDAKDADRAHTVDVWVTTGRDQASILRNLVDDNFTELYPGINIRVKLVAAGTLLPSTLAGTGPDVSLGNLQTEAINYAIRSAVMALNDTSGENGYNFNDFSAYEDDETYKKYYCDEEGRTQYLDAEGNVTYTDTGVLAWRVDTFDEVKSRFADEATVPLTLYGNTYGIPENMSFYMMFYRKDILADLELQVPNTWDDFYEMIYTLQSNKLEIGFPSGVTGSTILMYQQGETMYDVGNHDEYIELYGDYIMANKDYYYTDADGNVIPKTDGMSINLDSDIALACFKDVCDLFTMYDFPVTYDFANRFRSGEMPIAIADYTAYNQLIVFAPEINGMWEFTPLPGTMNSDGEINNTTVGTVTSMMMMRSVEDRKNEFASYVFMQWWSSAEAQSSYGIEMEALLGPSAKQNTANMEALYSMPWSKSEYDNLYAQFQNVTCTPEFPGGYIIARYTQFAFLGVYNNGDEPVEKLLSYITTINAELSRKRDEFGLPTLEIVEEWQEKIKDKND